MSGARTGTRKRALNRSRAIVSSALAFGLAAGLTACGGDDESAKPKTVAFKIDGSGKDLRLTAPKSVEGGLVRVQFTNAATGDHGAQLVRIEGQHTLEEALKAGNAWGESGRSLPTWLRLAGGVGPTAAGETSAATQLVAPGNYFVVDTDSNEAVSFQVTGETSDEELPGTSANVKATEYAFAPEGLKSGKNTLEFDNIGKEPHVLAAAPLKPGATIADVRRAIQEEKGQPPIEDEGGFGTAVIDGGVRQVVDVDLKPGRYALICFVPDREGGPPHLAKGMISEADVR